MDIAKPDLYDSMKNNSSLQDKATFVNQAIYNRENEIRVLYAQEHRLLAKKSFQDIEINELQELRNIQEKLKAIEIEMQILRRNTP